MKLNILLQKTEQMSLKTVVTSLNTEVALIYQEH